MKKILTIVLLLFVFISTEAQYKEPAKPKEVSYANFYLNFSTGIDNYTGLFGIGALFPYNDKFAVIAGAGIGGWGGKLSAGMKYEDLSEDGWGFGLSYSFCSELDDFDMTLQDQNGTTKTVNLDLLAVGSVNLTVNRNWKLRGDKVFYLETGYAIPVGGSDFYQINDGSVLSQDEELILEIMRPGGLILALGLLIGF
ncbi:MAG: hypothetical protein ACJA08_000441 [Cyclobacteriaceae bacterium]|jgi:hypothetical protein